MIIGLAEITRETRVIRVRGVRDEEAHGAGQTDGEGVQDVRCGLGQVGAELGVVCGVEEEVAECVVGVHDGDYGGGEGGGVAREAVVGYVCGDEGCVYRDGR